MTEPQAPEPRKGRKCGNCYFCLNHQDERGMCVLLPMDMDVTKVPVQVAPKMLVPNAGPQMQLHKSAEPVPRITPLEWVCAAHKYDREMGQWKFEDEENPE